MKYLLTILALVLSLTFLPAKHVNAGGFGGGTIYSFTETDSAVPVLFYFFDLRDRETFIQLTNPDLFIFNDFSPSPGPTGLDATAHIQIFDVSNNCNENDFFDIYTPGDTHVYNMRDIQTNDGNPSGVDLPDGAYGIVSVTMSLPIIVTQNFLAGAAPIGNLRIIDNNGYEYRTNAQAPASLFGDVNNSIFYSFNFNQEGGVSLSDVIGITLARVDTQQFFEWIAEPVQAIFSPLDIDIVNNNETIFSCRDILFSCVDEDNPLLEELLSIAGTASVASFEYGINNTIPHSRGGELLCPGNNIGEGTVILRAKPYPNTKEFNDLTVIFNSIPPFFAGYVGLNNGNGRGSFDSFWIFNRFSLNLP